MAPGPVTPGRILLAAAALAEAEQSEAINQQTVFKLRRRFQPIGPVPGVGVSKLVQYDVLLPPDSAVDIAKLIQFDVLVPPDHAVDIGKLVQYDVLVPPDNAVNVGKAVQYDVLVPPDNAVDAGKLVQYVALVPPDNAVTLAKIVQYAVLEAPPPIPRPLLWNSALVLSDLSGDIAPAPVLRKQNGAVPAASLTVPSRPLPLALMSASWLEGEQSTGALWPLWRRAVSRDAVQVTWSSRGGSFQTNLLVATEPDPVPPHGLLPGRRSASFDTWGQYPLPVPSAALIHAWIANNLPDDDPPWALWTRRFLQPDDYNQQQFPVRPLFWRMGTALIFPDPRVDVRKVVQRGRPPFNEYDPVIIVN